MWPFDVHICASGCFLCFWSPVYPQAMPLLCAYPRRFRYLLHARGMLLPLLFVILSCLGGVEPLRMYCPCTARVLPFPPCGLAQGEGLLMCPTSISFTLRALSAPFFFVQTCPTLFGVVHTFLLWNYTSLLPRMYRSSLPSFAAANARCCNMAQDLSSCHDDCPDFFLILIEARPIWKPPSPSEVTLQ
ncbi:hypothetical protein B0H13DRAFT_600734 [Mycena leptocephala]|nr:hypothetical protein B0H13DRAFT_600734 [Mycena leptocephala]